MAEARKYRVPMTSWVTVRVPVELDVVVTSEETDPHRIAELARQQVGVRTAPPLVSEDPLAWEVVRSADGTPEVESLDG